MAGPKDFDFWMGKWRGKNRRLRERLTGCTQWDELASTIVAQPLMNGLGNVDENHFDHEGGFIGVSIRLFDRATQRWSIYWVSDRSGVLEPPVVGSFSGNVGTFYGTDVLRGEPIRVRYVWSRVDTPTPRWEQAFSNDGGETWETNWVMEFSRDA